MFDCARVDKTGIGRKEKRKDYAAKHDSREVHGEPKLLFGLSQCRGGAGGGGVIGLGLSCVGR